MTGAPGPGRREPVTADDVSTVVDAAVTALSAAAADADWSVRAGDLAWSCWETVEHLADDFFAYAAQLGPRPAPTTGYVPFERSLAGPSISTGTAAREPGGPENTIRADPASGSRGLLEVLAAAGALLAAMVCVTPPEVRAHHTHGLADAEAFAAMGSWRPWCTPRTSRGASGCRGARPATCAPGCWIG